MKIILNLLVSAVIVLVVSYFVPGVSVDDFASALLVAFALGLVNIFVRPVLMLITLPVNIMTIGLFTFVVNGGLVMLVDNIVDGFSVDGFLYAMIFAVILGVVNAIFGK